jgi:hypothetical protein
MWYSQKGGVSMKIISFAIDKFVSYRLEGLDPSMAFIASKLEAHRYLMDFVYHSGEPMADEVYQELLYILHDDRFCHNAEVTYQKIKNDQKTPAV